MPGPRAVPVRMTIKRERKLRQVINAGTSPQRLVLRARIIMATAAGEENAQVARGLGCSVTTVRKWRKRFAEQGIAGIFDERRPGRPEIHGPSARLAVVAAATSVPPDGQSAWSHALLSRELRNGAWMCRRPPSGGSCPMRASGRTRSAAGSTALTIPGSGPGRAGLPPVPGPAAGHRPG